MDVIVQCNKSVLVDVFYGIFNWKVPLFFFVVVLGEEREGRAMVKYKRI